MTAPAAAVPTTMTAPAAAMPATMTAPAPAVAATMTAPAAEVVATMPMPPTATMPKTTLEAMKRLRIGVAAKAAAAIMRPMAVAGRHDACGKGEDGAQDGSDAKKAVHG